MTRTLTIPSDDVVVPYNDSDDDEVRLDGAVDVDDEEDNECESEVEEEEEEEDEEDKGELSLEWVDEAVMGEDAEGGGGTYGCVVRVAVRYDNIILYVVS